MKMSNNPTLVWKQAAEIFAKVAELSVNKALEYLDQIDDLSSETRQAVITLINTGNQASAYIQNNLTPDFNILSKPIVEYKNGTLLGEYELLEKIGQGGMSQVYKARRKNSHAQKPVAIKIFSPIGHSQQLLDNFINEQKILSDLSHPNIVVMLHGGKTKNNTAYLVMELIKNAMPIDQYFNIHPAPVNEKIKFIKQCADALSYSHANLIIHRDLKPDNILIDEHKKLKIVDFGIAKLIKNDIVGHKTTIMALTPSYAAPEQINSQKISVTTDVFSLAVVALDLLVGQQVLPNDRLNKSCVNDEHAIDLCLKSLNIEKDLKNILHHALQQDPQKRYPSMQSFADDLTNYLSNKPVNATSQSIYYRIKKFALRRSALFATLVSLLISLGIGMVVTYWQFQKIKLEAGKAQQVKQFMLDTFNITNPNISEGSDISAKDLLKIAAVKLKDNKELNSTIKFELYQSLGIANEQLGFNDEAIELLKQSLLIDPNNTKSIAYLAENYLNASHQKELDLLLLNTNESLFDSKIDQNHFNLVRARNLSKNGNSEQAIVLINKLKHFVSKNNSPREFVRNQQVLAGIYFDMSEYEKTIELLKSIQQESNLVSTNTLILTTKLEIGRTYNTMGEHDLALKEFNELEVIYKQILGENHPDLGELYFRMASSFRAKGQLKKAHEYAQFSYNTNVNNFGHKGLQVANSMNMLAVLAKADGDLEKSIELTKKAIYMLEQTYDKQHPEILELKTNYAYLLQLNKKAEESLVILKQVYEVQKNKLGIHNYSTLDTEGKIIAALTSLKQIPQAKELALSHLQRVQEHVNPKNIRFANAYFALARVYLYSKEKQKRLGVLLAVESQNLLSETDPYFVIVITQIGSAYNEIGDIPKAEEYYIKALRINSKINSDTHVSTLSVKLLYAGFLKSQKQFERVNTIMSEVKQIIKNENYKSRELETLIKRVENK